MILAVFLWLILFFIAGLIVGIASVGFMATQDTVDKLQKLVDQREEIEQLKQANEEKRRRLEDDN